MKRKNLTIILVISLFFVLLLPNVSASECACWSDSFENGTFSGWWNSHGIWTIVNGSLYHPKLSYTTYLLKKCGSPSKVFDFSGDFYIPYAGSIYLGAYRTQGDFLNTEAVYSATFVPVSHSFYLFKILGGTGTFKRGTGQIYKNEWYNVRLWSDGTTVYATFKRYKTGWESNLTIDTYNNINISGGGLASTSGGYADNIAINMGSTASGACYPPTATPPNAFFTVTPPLGDTTTIFYVDASSSTDPEDPTSALQVRWDWENDGIWDTAYTNVKIASHQYSTIGTKNIKLEVIDTGGLTGAFSLPVFVGIRCSPEENTIYETNMISDNAFLTLSRLIAYSIYGRYIDVTFNTIISKDADCVDSVQANFTGGFLGPDFPIKEGLKITPNGYGYRYTEDSFPFQGYVFDLLGAAPFIDEVIKPIIDLSPSVYLDYVNLIHLDGAVSPNNYGRKLEKDWVYAFSYWAKFQIPPDFPYYGIGVASPVDLLITDSNGNRIGTLYRNGSVDGIINEIPDYGIYTGPDTEPEFIILFNPPTGNYTVELFGTENGNYTLTFFKVENKTQIYYKKFENVSISLSSAHFYVLSVSDEAPYAKIKTFKPDGKVKIKTKGKLETENSTIKLELKAKSNENVTKGEFELNEKFLWKDSDKDDEGKKKDDEEEYGDELERKLEIRGKIKTLEVDTLGAYYITGIAKVQSETGERKNKFTTDFEGKITSNEVHLTIDGLDFIVPSIIKVEVDQTALFEF